MLISLHRFRSSKRPLARGFTLVELLVVISIAVVLTTIFLFQQRKFDSATLLRTLAYSVGLSMRQAQVYGTSVRESTPGVSGASAYGLYFSSGSPGSYVLFEDLGSPGNGKYDGAAEAVQTFLINSGYSITNVCVVVDVSTQYCETGTSPALASLAIYFKRPNPDSQFTALDSSGNPVSGSAYMQAYIQLTGPGGDTRSVVITNTGQITVQGTGT